MLLGCSQTVGVAYPNSAEFARNDVPEQMQRDVETVLAAKNDPSSKAALSCIISFAYMTGVRQEELEQARQRIEGTAGRAPRRIRRPFMPDGDSNDSAEAYCMYASKSTDPAIARVGNAYSERYAAELSIGARQAAVAGFAVEGLDNLFRAGRMNEAYRMLQSIQRGGAPPSVKARAEELAAAHQDELAAEQAFEARAEIRLLRTEEAELEMRVREGEAKGEGRGEARRKLGLVRATIREKHDELVPRGL